MSEELAIRTPMQEVCEKIASDNFAQLLKQALPDNVSVERFTRVTLTGVQQNPDLIGADRQSLYNSVIRCAQDGLLPNGQEAALVIFKAKEKGQYVQKVQYLPMIGGLRKRLAEQGVVLEAHVVHEGDHFDYELGLHPRLEHRPPKLGEERGKPIGAYAVAKDLAGKVIAPPEVMDVAAIEQVRAVSKAGTNEYGPWVKWWSEMARKTVARRLFKQLPLADMDGRLTRLLERSDPDVDYAAMEPDEYETHMATDVPFVPVEVFEPVEESDDGQTTFQIPASAQADQG